MCLGACRASPTMEGEMHEGESLIQRQELVGGQGAIKTPETPALGGQQGFLRVIAKVRDKR